MSISYYYKIDKLIAAKIPDICLTEQDSMHLINQLSEILNAPKIYVIHKNEVRLRDTTLKFICESLGLLNYYIMWKNLRGRVPLIAGSAYPESRLIVLYQHGQTLLTLLHEFAHFMENGQEHGTAWENNYQKALNCYLSLTGK
jgi:hypothetical protein